MTFFPGGRLRPPPGGGPQDAPWNDPCGMPEPSGAATAASPMPQDDLQDAVTADPATPTDPPTPDRAGSDTLPSVLSSDPPQWRLVFVIGRDWGAWIRVMAALAVLTVLLALLLGVAAAAVAYTVVQLPSLIAVLPPGTSTTIVGTAVTLLSGAALERRIRAWRAAHHKPQPHTIPE